MWRNNYLRRYCMFMLAALGCAGLVGCGGGTLSSRSSSSLPSSNSSAISVSASSLSFYSQTVNTTSSAQLVTISNLSDSAVSFGSIVASAEFAQTNTCGQTLAAGSNCTIKVTFTPTATGTQTGTLSIADTSASSPVIALSGVGVATPVPAATVTPANLTFSSQIVNSTSALETVTLTNSGNASLTLTGVSVSGDFAQSNNCGNTLSAGASCSINVTFTPSSSGTRTGTLSIADNAPSSPQATYLNGTGVIAGQLLESPTSISFGSVAVGTGTSQSVTITNSGGENVSVTSVSTSGAGVSVSGLSTPMTLAPNQTATFSITFDPTSAGAVTGTVYLTNDSTTPSVSIPVSGTGTAPASHEVMLAWGASSSTVIGYNTYRSSVSGGPYSELTTAPVNQTSYTDQNVQAGNTYYYVVTSVGTDMVESPYSNEAQATVPTT